VASRQTGLRCHTVLLNAANIDVDAPRNYAFVRRRDTPGSRASTGIVTSNSSHGIRPTDRQLAITTPTPLTEAAVLRQTVCHSVTASNLVRQTISRRDQGEDTKAFCKGAIRLRAPAQACSAFPRGIATARVRTSGQT